MKQQKRELYELCLGIFPLAWKSGSLLSQANVPRLYSCNGLSIYRGSPFLWFVKRGKFSFSLLVLRERDGEKERDAALLA